MTTLDKVRECWVCGVTAANMLRCSRCKLARKSDWPTHKASCAAVARIGSKEWDGEKSYEEVKSLETEVQSYVTAASAAERGGRKKEALKLWRNLSKIQPKQFSAQLMYAQALIRAHKPRKAHAVAMAGLQLWRNFSENQRLQWVMRFEQEGLRQAIRNLCIGVCGEIASTDPARALILAREIADVTACIAEHEETLERVLSRILDDSEGDEGTAPESSSGRDSLNVMVLPATHAAMVQFILGKSLECVGKIEEAAGAYRAAIEAMRSSVLDQATLDKLARFFGKHDSSVVIDESFVAKAESFGRAWLNSRVLKSTYGEDLDSFVDDGGSDAPRVKVTGVNAGYGFCAYDYQASLDLQMVLNKLVQDPAASISRKTELLTEMIAEARRAAATCPPDHRVYGDINWQAATTVLNAINMPFLGLSAAEKEAMVDDAINSCHAAMAPCPADGSSPRNQSTMKQIGAVLKALERFKSNPAGGVVLEVDSETAANMRVFAPGGSAEGIPLTPPWQ